MKVSSDVKTKDMYNFYKANTKEEIVEAKTYQKILKLFGEICFKKMMFERFHFRLPERMGDLYILKTFMFLTSKEGKKKRLPIDWNATKKLWEENEQAKEKKLLIKHLNKHTDGYLIRVKYDKKTANYKNKVIYNFKLNRKFTRELSAAVKNPKLKLDFFTHEAYKLEQNNKENNG